MGLLEQAREQRWYHTFQLSDDFATPGEFDLRPHVHRYKLPDDLTGKRCLDVGTWDGFWAFEMERRGAAEVVALDLEDEASFDWPPRRRPHSFPELHNPGFDVAKEIYGSSVERVNCSIYDARPDELGTFDVIFCGAMLIHLRDQLLALERIAELCTGLFISAEPHHRALSLLPMALSRFRANRPSGVVFWEPNAKAWRWMIWSAGFNSVREVSRFRLRSTRGYSVSQVVHHAQKAPSQGRGRGWRQAVA